MPEFDPSIMRSPEARKIAELLIDKLGKEKAVAIITNLIQAEGDVYKQPPVNFDKAPGFRNTDVLSGASAESNPFAEWRQVRNNLYIQHGGVDIARYSGSKGDPVLAKEFGMVVYAQAGGYQNPIGGPDNPAQGGGNFVVIAHRDGSRSRYLHTGWFTDLDPRLSVYEDRDANTAGFNKREFKGEVRLPQEEQKAAGTEETITDIEKSNQKILHRKALVAQGVQPYFPEVTPGQLVQKRQVIAHTGNTGYSRVPHLHYSVHVLKPEQKSEYRREGNILKRYAVEGIFEIKPAMRGFSDDTLRREAFAWVAEDPLVYYSKLPKRENYFDMLLSGEITNHCLEIARDGKKINRHKAVYTLLDEQLKAAGVVNQDLHDKLKLMYAYYHEIDQIASRPLGISAPQVVALGEMKPVETPHVKVKGERIKKQ